jgi:hypothetical protein
MPAHHPGRRERHGPTRGRTPASPQLRLGLAGAVTAITLAAAGCAGTGHAPAAGSAPVARAPGTTATSGGKGGTLPGAGYPPAFWTTIRQQLADRLHRSVAELTRLWGGTTVAGPKGSGGQASTTIVDVAAQDGLSTAQLRAAELAAIHHGFAIAVQRGTITGRQAGAQLATITSWDQSSMDGYAMFAYQPH